MRIVRLEAENVKRIVAVDITPEGDVVEITGKNRQGKTSVLDAILWGLGGATDIQSAPIRQGEDKAHIVIDLGDMKATRRFTRQEDGTFTTTLTLENADGAHYPGPQQRLNKLIETMSFDPGAFVDAKPDAQVATLRSLTGVDFTDLNAKIKAAYDERTAVNRTAKEMRSAASMVQVPDGTPEAEVDVSDILSQIEDASAHNADVERRAGNRRAAEARIEAIQAEIRTLTTEMHTLQTRLTTAGPLGSPIDIAELRAKADAAAITNAGVQAAKRRKDFEERAAAGEAKSAELTTQIDAHEAAKVKMISEAKMPVDGLGFGDGIVTLNGLPFDQASDAEQLEVSLAIVSAMNPELRIARVRDGSRLDRDAMALLAKFAKARDLQVWVETVQSDRPGAVVMVDGKVQAPAEKPPKATRKLKGAGS